MEAMVRTDCVGLRSKRNDAGLVLPRPRRPGDIVLDQPDYPSGAGIHVCLRGIRVCALPRRDSGWLALALRLWNASFDPLLSGPEVFFMVVQHLAS